jgi:hypothetical protein
MAKHVIFVIHGIGDHEAGWWKSVAQTLAELYGRYEVAQLLPFENQFEVKPLFYNDKFDALRAKWESAANEVLALMKPGPAGTGALQQLTEWAGGANKKTFLRTHVLDVLLYRFFPTVADQVRAAVHKQMLEGIKGAQRWSAIAHSMGTSVLHDTLVWMFDPDSPAKLPPEGFRMEVLAMLANVSRVLESSELGARWDAYRSVVQPNVKVTKGVCSRFLNVCHNWDPIPIPKKFKPTSDWPDAATRAMPGAFQDIRIDEIEEPKMVHDFEHYLRNPGCHIPLFRSLIPLPGVITPAEEKAAVDAHRVHHPRAKLQKEIDRLKALRLADEDEDWKRILVMIHKYFS